MLRLSRADKQELERGAEQTLDRLGHLLARIETHGRVDEPEEALEALQEMQAIFGTAQDDGDGAVGGAGAGEGADAGPLAAAAAVRTALA